MLRERRTCVEQSQALQSTFVICARVALSVVGFCGDEKCRLLKCGFSLCRCWSGSVCYFTWLLCIGFPAQS